MKRLFTCLLIAAMMVTNAPGLHAALIAPSLHDSSSTVDKAIVNDAMHEFKSLSRKERRARVTEAKQALKDFKKNRNADTETNTILLCILAILLPPLAVYLKEGETNSRFWLSVILTLLFWIPGVVYALLVVLDVV